MNIEIVGVNSTRHVLEIRPKTIAEAMDIAQLVKGNKNSNLSIEPAWNASYRVLAINIKEPRSDK